MDRKEKEITEILEKVHKQHEAELQTGFRTIAQNIMRHGMSPKEAFGVSNARMEALYTEGYKLYNAGNIKRAIPYFELLTMIDNKEPRFLFGLAACFQGLKQYKEAMQAYMALTSIDLASPFPLFHAADCALHEGDPLTALILIDMAIDRAGEVPAFTSLKEKAVVIKQGLMEKVKVGGQKADVTQS